MMPAVEAARRRRKRREFLTRPSPSSKDHGSLSRSISAHYGHHFFPLYCHRDQAEDREMINVYQHGCPQEHLQVLAQGGSSRELALTRRADFGQIEHSQQPVLVRGQARGNVCEAALEARDRLDQRFRASALARRKYYSNVNMDNQDECFWNFEAWKRIGIVRTSSPASVSSAQGSAGITTNERLAKDEKGVNQAALNSLQRKNFRSKGGKCLDSIEAESYEQPECPVCLETFLVGQMTLYLPCRHRFHRNCLVPWLEAHTQCPCCRAKVVVADMSD
ncbi:hypothetical protein O6H91_Y109700 [Diphasiastrum complanatum]|nr:hypothetical protein O6H91_Y109700 [Diphasiastrum complanatum]